MTSPQECRSNDGKRSVHTSSARFPYKQRESSAESIRPSAKASLRISLRLPGAEKAIASCHCPALPETLACSEIVPVVPRQSAISADWERLEKRRPFQNEPAGSCE